MKKGTLLVDHTNEIVGDYIIDKFINLTSHGIARYKAHCIHCNKVRTTTFNSMKTYANCKCQNLDKQSKIRFERDKNKVVRNYKVIGYYTKKMSLYYILECMHCHKKRYILASQLNMVSFCECHRHDNGRLKAKHNNEVIGDYILHDTGACLPNNRNRMYEAECLYCHNKKYGQYSDLIKRCNCHCQRI